MRRSFPAEIEPTQCRTYEVIQSRILREEANMRFKKIVPVVAGFLCFLAERPLEAQPSGCDSLTGVWNYIEPSPPGRSILAKLDDKYTFVYFQTFKSETAASAASTVGDSFAAGVGEYTCAGSNGKYQWKIRMLHSLETELVGKEQILEMSVEGDIARWSFVEADGKRVNPGAARRAK
jgi:hypothetical protein